MPSPKADEVVIKVMACGICGTDIHIFETDEGAATTPKGTLLGHEFSQIRSFAERASYHNPVTELRIK